MSNTQDYGNTKYGKYIEKYGDVIIKKYPNTNTKDLAVELNIDLKILRAIVAKLKLKKIRGKNRAIVAMRYPYDDTSEIARDLNITESYVRTLASQMKIKSKPRKPVTTHIDVITRNEIIIERYPYENTQDLALELFIDEQYLRELAHKLNLKKSKKHIEIRNTQIKKRYEHETRIDLAKDLNISVSYLNKIIRNLKKSEQGVDET